MASGFAGILLSTFARQLQLQNIVAGRHRVAVAVSGGSDSLALTLLAAWWSAQRGELNGLQDDESIRLQSACLIAKLSTQSVPCSQAGSSLPPAPEIKQLPSGGLHSHDGSRIDLVAEAQRLLQGSTASDEVTAAAKAQQSAAAVHAAAPLDGGVFALIVDHALRPGSRHEAEHTAAVVRGWGLQPVLLQAGWPDGPPMRGAMMLAARTARQRLFQTACSERGIAALLVAHQAGTVMHGTVF